MGSISQIRKPPHSHTFGMEVEGYPNVRGHPLWREGRMCGFWEPTYDGSIGVAGLEWVCQPMPYNMLIKQIKRLHQQIGGWKVDHRCGLHIHVSRGYWSMKRQQAFVDFMKTLNNSQTQELFGRMSNDYTDPHMGLNDKYRAINLLHDATYEFRMWAAGDLAWTLEALRRTRIIVQHRGKWTYDVALELFTQPN